MLDSARQPSTQSERPSLLFVDDEARVLNSMRIMFRRRYDLHTASDGAEALRIIRERDIDVIVADHRMPSMTGVEVLSAVREASPRTVRILLTGYADLDAVETSINECEVFRFLTKPCTPQQLRETIALASRLAREDATRPEAGPEAVDRLLSGSAPESSPLDSDNGTDTALKDKRLIAGQPGSSTASAEGPDSDHAFTATAVIAGLADEGPGTEATSPQRRLAQGLGVVVFSTDDHVVSTVHQAVRNRLPVYRATNIVQVVKCLAEHKPGVLATDISLDRATVQTMTARLKQYLPELVTIAIAEHRDVRDMVWLINHGQIFRFLRKPLSPGRCAVSLQAALQHHRALLRNPSLAKRHEVDDSGETGLMGELLTRLRKLRRLWDPE